MSLGTAGLANPAAASPAPTVGVPIASCDSPPDTPDATPENRDRFVELWSARFADSQWLEGYTDLATVPADILAEGFHDMDARTQVWLNACLLDDMLATAGETPTVEKRDRYLTGLSMVIFGKAEIARLRDDLAEQAPDVAAPAPVPVPQELTGSLEEMADDLVSEPSLTPADQPQVEVTTPTPSTTGDPFADAPELEKLVATTPAAPVTSRPQPAAVPQVTTNGLEVADLAELPVVPQLLQAVDDLLQLVSTIQGQLFTLPGLNLLASTFYKVCAESPTMPLSCSVSLPIGVPIPADVDGDNLPDVLAKLTPITNLVSVGARFRVDKFLAGPGPLPAHVFAVYDTPLVKKRIQVGFDGRATTLGTNNVAEFVLENAVQAVTGDVQVSAEVQTNNPGATESLTFAVKSLVGGSTGVLPSEEDPLTGAVQMSPFPEKFTVDARLTHTPERDQDTFTVQSATPTRVDAVIDQATTTTPKQSNRRFTATVDKLPTKVTVDLVRDGETQSIDYTGSAPIDLVRASDTATPDVTEPDSFTRSVYEVKGVPTHVHVDLDGARDIRYTASAKVPEVSFSTQTLAGGEPQQVITAKAHQIPTDVHVTNTTTQGRQAISYDADAELQDVELTMFDRDENDVETNLRASAIGIPTEMDFSLDAAKGVFDFAAVDGIDLVDASLTRDGGLLIPLPGDHATVHKRGDALGLDFQLSGLKSAHVDGSEDTTVALGLSPGGQSFDAIADLKDPDGLDALATAHVSELPTELAVTLSPVDGTASYNASSVIPLLEGGFTKRDTGTELSVALTDLPKNIALAFNTTGASPQVTYDADSRLGSIEATYQEAPGALAIHGVISDLPEHLRISGVDPIVFDARSSADAAAGSSHLGQVLFQYATDGVFQSPATTDDHVYLDTLAGTHAELQYTGLRLLSVDTSNQELHAEIRNTEPRLFRAYLQTLTMQVTGHVDKVPARMVLSQVGNKVTYAASSSIAEVFTELERSNGDAISASVKGVPSSVELEFDGANGKLDWQASAATQSIAATAHLTPATLNTERPFDASLVLTSIPSQWDASWADGNVLFQAPAPGIGSISAKVTNTGELPDLNGDHLIASYTESTGALAASLRISDLRKAGFTKLTNASGGGFEAVLDMGDHGTFTFDADVTLTDSRLEASGSFDNLPSALTLRSDGGRITYSGNSNPDLTLRVAAGAPAALAVTPEPSSVHGVSLRDGASGADRAVRANLFLTGLPSSLDLNAPAGTYTVGGYDPSIATLVVDVVLQALAAQPLSLQLQQVVPTDGPVSFTFGPFLSSTAADGTHTMNLDYTASRTLGSLIAEATYGNTDDARLTISSIPSSIDVDAAFGAAQKSVLVDMSHGIDDITASYKKVGAQDFAAAVHLHDVPSAVNLTLGSDTTVDGSTEVSAPEFTFTTSEAGMDIEATASAQIATPADITAAANLRVTDLGRQVTGSLDGATLEITSEPATRSFLLQAAGAVHKDFDLGFSGAGFSNTGNLDLDVDIRELSIGFEDAASLALDLGFTTGLRGAFDVFQLGLDTDTRVHIVDDLDFVIDWPEPFGSSSIDLFSINQVIDLGNVVEGFHVNRNAFGTIFGFGFDFGIGSCHVDFQTRPAPGFTTAGSRVSLAGPAGIPDAPPAWLITPDLTLLGISLPSFAMDLIAFFGSPYGNDFRVDSGCELIDLNPF